MDFVTWCDVVLRTVHELTQASANARMTGVTDTHIGRQIFGPDALTGEFWQSQQRAAIIDAVGGLASSGLLVVRDRSNLYKVTERGREHLDWEHHLDLLHTVAYELLQKQFIGGRVTMGLIVHLGIENYS